MLVLSGDWLLVSPRVQAGRVQRVNEVVVRCLNSSGQRICRRALIELEAFQRAAERANRYPCQTRALGLGADMLMQAEAEDRSASASALLAEIDRDCSGF